MPNPNYTAVMLLVDRSGSMSMIRLAAQAGINDFIAEQVKAVKTSDSRRTIRIAQFDDEYLNVHYSLDAAEVPPFKLDPRCRTALLDAMYQAITEFGLELAVLPEDERPGNVIFAVMTDGAENASTHHDWAEIRSMIEHQQSTYGWQVLYLGANQDAIAVAADLGIRAERAMTYRASDAGTRSVTRSMSHAVAMAAGGQSVGFTDEQRHDSMSH